MAKTQTKSQTTSSRRSEQRKLFTLEYATALCPHRTLADNLATTFGLEPVDPAAIREAIEEHTVRSANALVDNLNEKAMQIHLQRVVAAFVGSACGAGQFYGQKVSQARDITNSPGTNDIQPDLSPDGQQVAYSSGTNGLRDARIVVQDLHSGQTRAVTPASLGQEALDPSWLGERREEGILHSLPFKYAEVERGKELAQNVLLLSGDTVVVP